MTDISIRTARREDAAMILDIYGPVVASSSISFETSPPSLARMEARIADTLKSFPWLVAEKDGMVIGYCYAGKHSSRGAYNWSAVVSVYISDKHHGQGLGTMLYKELIPLMKSLGYYNLYAVITLPNPGSIALHEKNGFSHVGSFNRMGFKHGRWHDVGWWECRIQSDRESGPSAQPLCFAG